MLKEAKRKARLSRKKAKRKSSEQQIQMHDIQKTITLEDLTNPDKK